MSLEHEFAMEPPTHLIIAQVRHKFETHASICDVHKGRSGSYRTATSDGSLDLTLEQFIRSAQSLPRIVHVRQELAVEEYGAFL